MADEAQVQEAEPEQSAYANFRHSGWSRLRSRVRDCLVRAREPESRIRKFDACGAHASFYTSPSTKATRIQASFCRHRFCVPCANARSSRIKTNLAAWLKDRTTRFLTFTLHQNGRETSEQMLSRLRRSLTLMYRRHQWQHHVSGWATFIELKRSSRQKQWHIHAHILCEGQYWDQKEMSYEWHACTGDSFICDIRAVTDARGGAYYAAKYACKPGDVGSLETDEELEELVRTIGHKKLYTIGGTWKGKLKLLALADNPGDWEFVGYIDDIIRDANQNEPAARAIWQAIQRGLQERGPPPVADQHAHDPPKVKVPAADRRPS